MQDKSILSVTQNSKIYHRKIEQKKPVETWAGWGGFRDQNVLCVRECMFILMLLLTAANNQLIMFETPTISSKYGSLPLQLHKGRERARERRCDGRSTVRRNVFSHFKCVCMGSSVTVLKGVVAMLSVCMGLKKPTCSCATEHQNNK